jgi:metallo-beta-lactamase class B
MAESEYDRGSVLKVEQVNPMEHEGRSPSDQRTMRRRVWRPILVLLVAVAAVAIPVLARMWKAAGDRGGLEPVEPFRIAGNFYYVGANASSVFLITGPEGHVLIDGGRPATPPLIMASIAELGFDIRDVKVLLNSDPFGDHAGGLAALQQASGAQLWASRASADVIASGGVSRDMAMPLRALVQLGVMGYPPARVDHQFIDGDTIRVGPIALTAHITGGSARGNTSWSFSVRDGDRVLNVVSVCSLGLVTGIGYPEGEADLTRAFALLRRLPVDIWVTGSPRGWGRYRKFAASRTASNRVDPFIDPAGYRAYIDAAEDRVRKGLKH